MSHTPSQESPRTGADEPLEAWKTPRLEGVDELSARAFRAFIATAKLHFKNMMTTMAGDRTHHGQAMCLRLLSVNDGATQRDVARMLRVSPPTVSKMLSTMEKAGLVERKHDEADQRLTRVYLTSAGRDRGAEMSAVVGEYVNATFARLSERERRELARLLEKLGESIARVSAVSGAAAEPADAAARGADAADRLAVRRSASPKSESRRGEEGR